MKTQIQQNDLVGKAAECFGRELIGRERGGREDFIVSLEQQTFGTRKFACRTADDATALEVAVAPGAIVGGKESPVKSITVTPPRGKILTTR